MPRGGLRPGAGRPKSAQPKEAKVQVSGHRSRPPEGGLTPLDYMLSVMNDPNADDARRDRMAIAAAVYTHGKPGDEGRGVKAKKQEAGERVSSGGGKYATPAPPKLVVDNR